CGSLGNGDDAAISMVLKPPLPRVFPSAIEKYDRSRDGCQRFTYLYHGQSQMVGTSAWGCAADYSSIADAKEKLLAEPLKPTLITHLAKNIIKQQL
ncbi:hypothetical protein ILUMI_16554, partial [Ignelater luminosus]